MVKEKVKDETKHDRFVRLGTNRTQNVLKALRILGNCANPHTYQYSKTEVEKIFKTLKDTVEETHQKFQFNLKPEKEFKL